MKENSKEEDIKNAEHFIKSIKTDKEYKEENGWHGYYNKEIVELARMLEHILSDYKRVLKENEELKESNRKLYEIGQEMCKQDKYTSENYIPVQKVKDKIEEIDKIYNDIPEDEGNFAKAILIKEKQVLQELLEGRK